MISTNQFKKGMALVLDGQLHTIVDYQHVKPGKGGAFMRTKLRRLKDGATMERTFRAGEKFQDAYIEERKLQFLYRSGSDYHMMDMATYEDYGVSGKFIGDKGGFLKDNMELAGKFHNGEMIGLELPLFVDLKVTHTEPGIRGDTAKGGSKPATVETGATIQVPLFVESGEVVRVDTRTGAYVSRA